MKIGYARVSTNEQNLDLQKDALLGAGCDKIFEDHISGAKAAKPGLDQALMVAREGDSLVVWKLDRLGRTLKGLIQLMDDLKTKGVQFESVTDKIDTSTPMGQFVFHVMAAMAQMERDLIRERTNAGLTAARARGKKGGRRPVTLDDKKVKRVLQLATARGNEGEHLYSVDEICSMEHIGRSTFYRYVQLEKETPKIMEVSSS